MQCPHNRSANYILNHELFEFQGGCEMRRGHLFTYNTIYAFESSTYVRKAPHTHRIVLYSMFIV